MKTVTTSRAPLPIGPYSQAVIANGMAYLSGQIALHPESGALVTDSIENETHQVMQNIAALLEACGSGFDKVVKASIFLSDMDNFGTVNTVYGSYFTGNYPARETVQVSCLPKKVNVEISVIALV